MENSALFSTAKELAERLKRRKPCYSELEAAVIAADKGTFLGVTGVNVADGRIIDVPADVSAVLNMKNCGGRAVQGLAVIKLTDMSFVPPSAEAMELLFRMSMENDGCLVCLGENESRLMSALRLGMDGDSMMDGFGSGFGEEESGAGFSADTTANVISGVAVDESNPFYENAEDIAPPEETLSVMSEEQKANTLVNTQEQPELTPEELLRQAKKRKEVAKSNFLFKKKHK